MDPTKDDVDSAAASILARRDHSRGELRKKLLQRGFEAALIDEVLDDYQRRGWLNDVSFARQQAEILARKAWGPAQIQAKLGQHGVGREVASQVVDELEVDWAEVARQRVRQKFRNGDAARAYRHLVQRGFPSGLARKVAFEMEKLGPSSSAVLELDPDETDEEGLED